MTTTRMLMLALLAVAIIEGKTQEFSWEDRAPLPAPRRYCTAAVLDGRIYVMGGQFFSSPIDTFSVVVFDPAANTWDTDVAPLPVLAMGAAASAANGKIYFIGGSAHTGPFLSSVFEYDPVTDKWTKKADMPTPRFFLNTAVVDGKVYALGGRTFNYPPPYCLSIVEMYDPATDTWTAKTDMRNARSDFAAEVVDGKIYVMGGVPDNTSVEVYDPQTDTWTEMDDMPYGKAEHGSGVIDGEIFLFGGLPSEEESGGPTWKFDPGTGIWQDIEADLPIFMAGFASGAVGQCLYTIGGMNMGTMPINNVFMLCPIVNSARAASQSPGPAILHQNFPNPFDSYTMIRYELRIPGEVSIKVFNLAGQEVGTAFTGFQQAGRHEAKWAPAGLEGGVYLCRLQTGEYTEVKKLVLQK